MTVLTPEEKTILYPEYERYLEPYKNQWYCLPLSFDDWWRETADNAKDNQEGK